MVLCACKLYQYSYVPNNEHHKLTVINERANINLDQRSFSTAEDFSRVKNTEGHKCNHSYTVLDDDLNLEIVPRRAYFDNRTVSGKPRNLVMVLAELLDNEATEKSIVSCELNGHHTKARVVRERTTWVREFFPGHTHANSYVYCEGFPKEVISNGSTVRLVYRCNNTKFNDEDCYCMIAVEKPLVLMKSGEPKRNSIVICTALYDRPPYFDQWLKYQHTIGIDKVHLNVEASFAENATSIYPSLKEALDTGFVSMEVWKNYVANKIYYYSHTTKLQDCVMRYTGVYDYTFVCDVDEFFVPLVPDEKDIHYYVNRFFNKNFLSSINVSWRRFLCKPDQSLYRHLRDGNVTQALTGPDSSWDKHPKTIHRLAVTGIVGAHKSFSNLPGYKSTKLDRRFAYMGHVRPTKS